MMVEVWKDIPNYEGCYQVSNLGNVKSVERVIMSGYNHHVKRVVPEKMVKLYSCKRSSKVVARVMHNSQCITFDVNALVTQLFPKESPQLTLDLTPKMNQNDFSKEIMSIVNDWDSFTPAQIKSKLSDLANTEFEQKEVGVSMDQIQSLKEQVMSVFDSFTNTKSSLTTQTAEEFVKTNIEEGLESKDDEVWLPVKGTDDKYFVSNYGGFKYTDGKKFFYPKGYKTKSARMVCVKYKGNKTLNKNLSQLVLNTFNNTNITRRHVFYKNGNHHDCALSNISWK